MPSVQPIQQQLLIVRGPLFHKLIISASPASISELFASAISKINTFTRGSCSFPLFIQYALKIIRKQLNKYLEMKPQSTSKTSLSSNAASTSHNKIHYFQKQDNCVWWNFFFYSNLQRRSYETFKLYPFIHVTLKQAFNITQHTSWRLLHPKIFVVFYTR